MDQTPPFWESCYQAGDERTTFGEPSKEIVALASRLRRGARVLDLGCGDGRHAMYLARLGHQVTAIDISRTAIEKLRRLANEVGTALRALLADMREYAFEGLFDVIIAHGSLHLIERYAWARVIERMKAHTRPGGQNAIAVFTDTLPSPEDLKAFHIGLFREGELFDLYQDWRIVLQKSYVFEDEHPGDIRHRHPVNKLLAERPTAFSGR